MSERDEQLWREYWKETHKPDSNGKYYWERPSPIDG